MRLYQHGLGEMIYTGVWRYASRLPYQLTRLAPTALRPAWHRYYSMEGEDIVLLNFFPRDFQGIYVDIGAHHPTHCSNTKKLADCGWWGLAIDPMPGLAERFKKHRPRDICMEVAIDIGAGNSLYYWMFDRSEPQWNCLAPTEPLVERGRDDTARRTSRRAGGPHRRCSRAR